ncbi:MAG: N-acetyl-gamma-glutamyl-phosphate reductase [Rhodospirillales bacterium]|nr:N-acetyl-gamma-glutamyl-phosphate reductase [Rhodospirillales bacterium]
MTARIFIDGDVGTTGLQIRTRLEARDDIELLRLDEASRKDPLKRAELLNTADISILCLPDAAALEAVSLVTNPAARLIDASTAHRIADGWAYGFPEYSKSQAAHIAASGRVANPGCYALTSVSILYPLVEAGLIPRDWPVTINAVSGYSGGGKDMIAEFEDVDNAAYTRSPFFAYGLGLQHKHLPEITRWGGLAHSPLFVPSVGRYAQGMLVQVPLPLWSMPGPVSAGDIHAALSEHYQGQRFVSVVPLAQSRQITRLDPEQLNNTNELHLHVFADEANGQAVVAGVLDNLGKGASGQAVQNLNLMLGMDPATGL